MHPSNTLPRWEQFAAIRRYQPTLAFSPDGAYLAYSTNTSGQFNVWVQAVDGGCAEQRTMLTEQTVRSIAWSPDGTTLAFSADTDGAEDYHLFLLPARGGWPALMPATPPARHPLIAWSSDGAHVAYSANDREPTEVDVVVQQLADGTTHRLSSGMLCFFAAWAHDNRRVLGVQIRSSTNTNIYLLAPDAPPDLLTPHAGDATFMPLGWTADDRHIYFLSNAGREFMGLAVYDLAQRTWQWAETPRWDVEEAALSQDGTRVAWTVNEDGYSTLYVRDLSSGALLPVPDLPRGVISGLTVSNDGRRVALLLNRATQPAEVVVVDLQTSTVRQLTHSFLGGLCADDLIKPELVHYPSFDGRHIPAFVYKPNEADGPMPVVVAIHGGPEWQERPDYKYVGLYQYLVSRGIAVLAPNIRGSTGYGLSYQKLIHRDWGGDDLQDIEAAAQYLHQLPWVDPQRIAVFGGSYGGFATLSAVARMPQWWCTGVDVFGPSNLITFVQNVPPHWRSLTDGLIGNPETDRDMLITRSPITYVDQITAPLFIIQGAKDPRVVQSESDQIVERLRALGRNVRYDVYPDEGHGFTKRANEVKVMGDIATWLEAQLRARDAVLEM